MMTRETALNQAVALDGKQVTGPRDRNMLAGLPTRSNEKMPHQVSKNGKKCPMKIKNAPKQCSFKNRSYK